MGLDQYAWAQRPEIAPLEFITERGLTDEEQDLIEHNKVSLMQWRKHADLNAWMTALYERKGGTEEFNCITMPLTKDDILSLRMHLQVNGNSYQERGQGFFWGESRDTDIALDHAFIEKAINALDEGYEVFYSCWY